MIVILTLLLLLVSATEPSPLAFHGSGFYRVLRPFGIQEDISEVVREVWGEVENTSFFIPEEVTQLGLGEEEVVRENGVSRVTETLWGLLLTGIEYRTRYLEVHPEDRIKCCPKEEMSLRPRPFKDEVALDDHLKRNPDPRMGIEEQGNSLFLARALDDLLLHRNYAYASRVMMRLHSLGAKRGDPQGVPNRVTQTEKQEEKEDEEEASSPVEVAERLKAEVEEGEVTDYEALGCGLKNIAARILGGVVAQPGEWPWQGALVYRPLRRHFCGVSLINAQFVLTAAHCARLVKRRDLEVWLGTHDITLIWEAYRQIRQVTHVIVHEEFKQAQGFHNDLALLRLDEPIVFTYAVRPICLPDSEDWDDHLTVEDESAVVDDVTATVDLGTSDDRTLSRAVPFLEAPIAVARDRSTTASPLPLRNTTTSQTSKDTTTTNTLPLLDNTIAITLSLDSNDITTTFKGDSTTPSPHPEDITTSIPYMDNITTSVPSIDNTTIINLPPQGNNVTVSPFPTAAENVTTSASPARGTPTFTPAQPKEGKNVTLTTSEPTATFITEGMKEEEPHEVVQLHYEGVVMGWGLVKEDGLPSALLQQVELPFIPLSKCHDYYAHIIPVTEHMLCTLHPEHGVKPHDSCRGDSGGAIVVEGKDQRWTQVGVISFGYGCGRPGFPGVYTRITKYLLWIYIKIFQTERDQLNRG